MSASGGEARAPAAPKFLRGGDLYEYVPPERIVDGSSDDDAEETMADDSGDDDWLRRGLTADSSDFDRTALTDGRSTLTGGGRSESTHPDLSLTRSATAAIAREMTRARAAAGAMGRCRDFTFDDRTRRGARRWRRRWPGRRATSATSRRAWRASSDGRDAVPGWVANHSGSTVNPSLSIFIVSSTTVY